MSELQIEQSKNLATVVGKLKEKKLEVKTSSNGKEYMGGYIVLQSDTQYGSNEIKIAIYQNKLKEDGTVNNIFKGLETVNNVYQIGDLIEAKGYASDESYYSVQKDQFVNKFGIKASFFNRVNAEEEEERVNLVIEAFIDKINHKEDGVEVELISVGFKGVAIPLVATIREDLVEPFLSLYQPKSTATFNISVINSVEIEEEKAPVFGEKSGEKIKRTISKNIIYGGTEPNFTKYNDETIKKALAIRMGRLEERKEATLSKLNTNTSSAGYSGFNAGIQNNNNNNQNASFGVANLNGGSFGAFK